ncbi:MAG: substrate-binding domain-containing protein [Planctomycetota bacterium]
MNPEVRIAVLVRPGLAFGREVIRGIARYARQQPHWRLHSMVPYDPVPPRRWIADGGIGHTPPDDWHGLLGDGAPRVLVGFTAPAEAAQVSSNDTEIARLGVDHLIGLGLRNVVFAGEADSVRGVAFQAAMQAAEQRLLLMPPDLARSAQVGHTPPIEAIAAWLREAPKPLGVMAIHDVQARLVSVACRIADLRVPDDVAILGIDNDELLCELSDPPLSSIDHAMQEVGYEAAALLNRMLNGGPVERVILPPKRVVTRRSTDVLAIDDPDVVAALRYIRTNGAQNISIDDVARSIPAARRTLERRFKKVMGHSLLDEVLRVRVNTARNLLITTDRPLPQVAESSGFNSLKHFHEVFRRRMGVTPVAFRRKHQMR